jgi:hypothetical protein
VNRTWTLPILLGLLAVTLVVSGTYAAAVTILDVDEEEPQPVAAAPGG